MSVSKKEEKWTRPGPVKIKDCIISSDFAGKEPFKPSYEKKRDISMFKLLAMDYQRQWHDEKNEIKDAVLFSNEAVYVQRRYVIRGMLRRMQQAYKDEKRFIMKRFMNIPSRYLDFMRKGAKKGQKQASVEKIAPTIKKDLGPCDENTSEVSPDTSHPDLITVHPKEKVPCGKKEESKEVGKPPAKRPESGLSKMPESGLSKIPESGLSKIPESGVRRRTPVPETSAAQATIVVAAAQAEAPTAGEVEAKCVCKCSCACKAFRNAGDEEIRSSSTLPDYKSVDRDSVDEQITAPIKCHIHV